MAISARESARPPNFALRPGFWAGGAVVVLCAVLATSCGGGGEPFLSVVIALRTDGGSPALSAFAGDLENNPIELPPGTYYVKAVNENGDTFPFNEVEIGPGETFGVAPFSASFSSWDMAHSVRVLADFVFEIEIGRLGALESMSGGYTTTLFDPEGDPDGDDLQALYDTMDSLAGQEEEVRDALSIIQVEIEVQRPVAYVSGGASPPRDAMFDQLLFGIFFAAGQAREQARGRVTDALTMAKNLKIPMNQLFHGMPDELKGTARSFDEWARVVESGDLDSKLGKIEGFLGSDAALELGLSERSIAKTMAEVSAPLIGADVSATSHGDAPGVYRAADLTAITKKWTEYARQFYGDGSSDPNQQKKDRDQLGQLISNGLSSLAPALSPDVVDSVARRISGELVSAIPSLKDDSPPRAVSDEEWVEGIVQTVADKLLADGESGIDTAVVTDDLRQCLNDALKSGASRNDALGTCEDFANSSWIDEALYYARDRLVEAGMREDDAVEVLMSYAACLDTKRRSGATRDEALAACRAFLDAPLPPAEPTPGPTVASTPAPTLAPTPVETPCNIDEDGDTVIDFFEFTDCFETPTP